jgi:hypothetical protein
MNMQTKTTDIIMQNKIFLWIALFTGFILLIPLLSGWDWDETDFIIIGILLFGMGSLFVLTARNIKSGSKRMFVGGIFLIAVLYIWAELAVGIFFNFGS